MRTETSILNKRLFVHADVREKLLSGLEIINQENPVLDVLKQTLFVWIFTIAIAMIKSKI